ncbi:GNAT family N-acetyltransferase [Granulicella arctica]|uniref:Ribosomal protein S18 acetylase RimI-like enzyme n=1 Tax=Granulicella arctica TaxID=940613 RepID=A0A7Y9PG34_9BACT|nr:GNAT family N-acetyltransferase [Granulicella arctica]NYF78516.1 ribosomal protein S18 acetylase RimI-like enzyme [Granulicella arctica]
MELDDIALRSCTLKDTAALALVGAATFLEAFAGTLDGEAIVAHCAKQHSVETYTKYLSRPDCKIWLAETREGAAPVGYAMLTQPDLPLPDLSSDDIELKRIYLFSRFHGKGAGQMLLDQSVTAAAEMNKRRLLLGVYRGNLRGLAFYRKNGFVDAGIRTFMIGHRQYDDLILSRPL